MPGIATPQLQDIASGDKINYNGQADTIATVNTVTNDGYERYTVNVTLTTSGVTINLSTADTALSSFEVLENGTTVISSWVQTIK
jgi:hypothetical protein